jgi:hypothetical protein
LWQRADSSGLNHRVGMANGGPGSIGCGGWPQLHPRSKFYMG